LLGVDVRRVADVLVEHGLGTLGALQQLSSGELEAVVHAVMATPALVGSPRPRRDNTGMRVDDLPFGMLNLARSDSALSELEDLGPGKYISPLDLGYVEVDPVVPPLGQGRFGQAVLAQMHGQPCVVKKIAVVNPASGTALPALPASRTTVAAAMLHTDAEHAAHVSHVSHHASHLAFKRVMRALDEAQHLMRLDHPHIVRYFDVFGHQDALPNGTFASYVCIAVEYCDGGALADFVLEHGLSLGGWLDVQRQLLEGLAYLHDVHGIVHRDIKMENVLLQTGEF
jgi:serine/threonine protein kinase